MANELPNRMFRFGLGYLAALAAATCMLYASPSRADRGCEAWHADLLTAEGTVEVRRARQSEWLQLVPNEQICTGDAIRVQAYSRATLKLPDETVLRLDANTSLTLSEPDDDTGSWIDLIRGLIQVISRDPRALKFSTPYANAGLEGTEFVIQVSEEQTAVTVLEGEVVLSNPSGRVAIRDGQQGSARRGQSPSAIAVANPVDFIRWGSYYVPILDGRLPDADQRPAPSQARDAEFYAARAARRLRYGRLQAAEEDLAVALAIAPGSATATALQSVVASKRNDHTQALSLARRAVRFAPNSATPWLALSHAQQSAGELPGPLQSAGRAVEIEPRNATAWARLAEARLAAGDPVGGVEAATRAAQLRPAHGHAQAVLGFAQLSQMRPESAARAFAQAIALDQAAPLPRIGLGLALIQRGRLADGRRQLEIAVILDPTDALVRSYMAKVYDAEHRTELAATQLQLAKAFNPDDPTPWLYDAAHKYSENRPIDALRDLRTAIDLNDDRAVYRSRLRVDEDLAARSAAWGSLHRELNFEALALAQGWKSIARDPTDYTGHRLLADVYSTRPRHEIARVNELFQSQLLQPINLTPIQPQLAEVSEFISDSVGPSELAMGEFSPLLSRNGLKFRGSAVLGDHATRGEDIVVAGLHDRISYSVGQFSFETDGFRRNNDLEQRVGNAFVQFRPSHATSLQAELRASEAHKGDLSMLFDRAEFSPTLRQDESVDSVRLGLRRELSDRATLLSSLIYHDVEVVTTSGPLFSRTTDVGGYSVDVQHVYRASRWHTSAGFVYSSQDRLDVTTLAAPLPSQPAAGQSSSEAGSDLQQESAYVYATLAVQPRLDITIGASADRVATVGLQGSRLNPKLGMLWEPTDRTTVRAAAFKTLQGPLVSKRNIQPRLEPVHVAGFNQLFFGADAERASRYGAAIDHQFSAALFGGAEISTRKLDVPLRIFVPPSTTETLISVAADEYLRRAYLNWAPTARFSFSAEYEAEKFDNGGELLNGFTTMQLRRLPLELRYFHPLGVTAGLRASHIRQDGRFGGLSFGPGSPIELGEDDFWVFDASLGYRLPDRRGLLSLNIHNLFDQEFRFQDTDPENPRVLPERMVSFRFTLAFQ